MEAAECGRGAARPKPVTAGVDPFLGVQLSEHTKDSPPPTPRRGASLLRPNWTLRSNAIRREAVNTESADNNHASPVSASCRDTQAMVSAGVHCGVAPTLPDTAAILRESALALPFANGRGGAADVHVAEMRQVAPGE